MDGSSQKSFVLGTGTLVDSVKKKLKQLLTRQVSEKHLGETLGTHG